MKFYQCKHERKINNTIIIGFTTFFGVFAIDMLGNFGFIAPYSETDRVANGLLLLACALIGAAIYVYNIIYRRYDRIIEISDIGITYHAVDRTATMKWVDVSNITLDGSFYRPNLKIIFFYARGVSLRYGKFKVTEKRMWSEYNDAMLEEIRKHWHGLIKNEDLYKRYKKKERDKQRRRKSKQL